MDHCPNCDELLDLDHPEWCDACDQPSWAEDDFDESQTRYRLWLVSHAALWTAAIVLGYRTARQAYRAIR